MSNVIDELKQLAEVYLPSDPLEGGFKKLSQAVCDLQKNLVRTTQITIDALENVKNCKRQRGALSATLELKQARLKAIDEDVKKGKSQAERESVVLTKTKDDFVKVEKARMGLLDADAVLKQAEYVLSCLKHTKEISTRQLDMVQKEMDLGLINSESIKDV